MINYFLLTPLFLFLANLLALAPFDKEVEHYSTLESSTLIQLNEDYSVVYKREKTVLIWDRKGLNHSDVNVWTNSFTEILKFEAEVINPANGKVIRKYKLKDLKQKHIVSGGTFYSENVNNIFNLASEELPVKVKLSYEYVTRGNFYFDDFEPIKRYNQIIKKSDLEVVYPEKLGIRYKLENVEEPKRTNLNDHKTSLKWTFSNLEAIDKNYDQEKDPHIYFAPIKFSLLGNAGEMDSWAGMAKWYSNLNKDKGTLPDDFKIKVKEMVDGVDDDFEKLSILYNYIQKNYRYVAISLGIGGWMSASAEETIKNKYGECKALSTLLKAMLKEVGISSDYVLVNAGSNEKPIDSEFISTQFNHVFLRVPIANEIFWVECTSPYGLPGFSGKFTHDRDVLIVKDDDGYITRTPAYKEDKFNNILSNHQVKLHASGHADVISKTVYSGFLANDIKSYQYHLDTKKSKEYIQDLIAGRGLDLKTYSIIEKSKLALPCMQLNFEGTIQHFAQQTTKRVIIPSQWVELHEDLLPVGRLKWISQTAVETYFELELENSVQKTNEEFFSISTAFKKTDLGLLIEQEILIDFPDDLKEEVKASQLYKINNLAKADILLKKI